jgi:hypothetical protein
VLVRPQLEIGSSHSTNFLSSESGLIKGKHSSSDRRDAVISVMIGVSINMAAEKKSKRAKWTVAAIVTVLFVQRLSFVPLC